MEVEIRAATPDDLNLIRKSWMRSYRKAAAMDWVAADVYDAGMPRRISRILTHPDTRIFLASPPGDTITAFGFLVGSDRCLHYVWTKDGWRQQGIARRLVEHAFPGGVPVLTHITRMGRDLWLLKSPHSLYDPFGVP